jgi:hypothetical protein
MNFKVGDWIYIDSVVYLGHGEDDIRGGLAKIKTIQADGFVEFEGFERSRYNLAHLLPRQAELKSKFGTEKAKPDPDLRPEFNQG